MTLEAIALTAILSQARAPAVDVVTERPRLEQVASDIAAAVDGATRLPFAGTAAGEATALAMVAIAKHESEFSARVQDCRRTGDVGRSLTLYQLLQGRAWGSLTRADLCDSNEVATARALVVLTTWGAARRVQTPGALFAAYAGAAGKASRETCAIWVRLAKDAGLLVSCGGGLTVRPAPLES